MDIMAENIVKLKELFSNVLTEGKIGFEVMWATLGECVEKEDKHYSFTTMSVSLRQRR